MEIRFLYWATIKDSNVKVNFISENFYEVGSVVEYNGITVIINDLAIEPIISCEELKMQMEDMRYYV